MLTLEILESLEKWDVNKKKMDITLTPHCFTKRYENIPGPKPLDEV